MTTTTDKTTLQSIIRLVENLSSTSNYDTIISILSLLCLFSILNHTTPQQSNLSMPSMNQQSTVNPLQKLLGDLLGGNKTDGNAGLGGALSALGGLGGGLGGLGNLSGLLSSPDLLMSLLPLLNNSQLKSKINPSSIASVMSMINNLSNNQTEKTEPIKNKQEAPAKTVEVTETPPPNEEELQATPTPEAETSAKNIVLQGNEKKPPSRFLNWKTNF